MSLTVYKRPFSRSYENEFYREFSAELRDLFSRKGWHGKLYGSPLIEIDQTLQLDALLVTEHFVIIIDFKNYGGEVVLPEDENLFEHRQWRLKSGDIIKGGNSINPFKQLQKQAKKLEGIFERQIFPLLESGDKIELYHFKRIVCFQKEVSFNVGVPSKRELTFFLADTNSICNQLEDILDVEGTKTRISPSSLIRFDEVFKANLYEADLPEVQLSTDRLESNESMETVREDGLKEDQFSVIETFKSFLNSDEDVLVINGSSQSGKSTLLPYLKQEAFNEHIHEVQYLAYSSKVANQIQKDTGEHILSLYSLLYQLGEKLKIEDKKRPTLKEYFPSKIEHPEDKTLFIIDEGHLIANGYMQLGDFRFGSGHLLEDFIKYCDFPNAKPKCVILADPYIVSSKRELQLSNINLLESEFNLTTREVSLIDNKLSLADNSGMGQALTLKAAMNNDLFNQLSFSHSDSMNLVDFKEVPEILNQNLADQFWDFKYLTFKNEDVLKINKKIRSKYLGLPSVLAPGDLLTFHTGLKIQLDQIGLSSFYIRNGDFLIVKEVGNPTTTEPITLSGREESIRFTFMPVVLNLKGSKVPIPTTILLEYLVRDKPELTTDETIALQVLFDRELKTFLEENPNADKEAARKTLKVKSVYTNHGLVRYGWALTVERSVPMKFNNILVNCDPQFDSRGRSNRTYFSWLYSAISRNKSNCYLVGFNGYSCWKDIEIRKQQSLCSLTPPQDTLHIDILSPLSSDEIKLANQFKLDLTQIALVRYAFNLSSIIEPLHFKIASVRQMQYQEEYTLRKNDGDSAVIRVSYNGKFEFKKPTLSKGKEEHVSILSGLIDKQSEKAGSVDQNISGWKSSAYDQLKDRLHEFALKLNKIDSLDDKLDRVYISREEDKVVIDIFNKPSEGFFSVLICQGASSDQIWGDVNKVFLNLKSNAYGI